MTHLETFLSQLKETNLTLDTFVDFEKVELNVQEIEIKLHALNYLLGKHNFEQAVKLLWEENPSCFSVLNILIAVRNKKQKVINKDGTVVKLSSYFVSYNDVLEFLKQSGLQHLFQSGKITNLVDYVFGIEVGLDSNARKNRGGKAMERYIARLLDAYHLNYQSQVSNFDFDDLKKVFGEDEKRFDFVIFTPKIKYLVEVNFYNVGGSKLNEVARAYIELEHRLSHIQGYEFVWITDGMGWTDAKSKFSEALKTIKHVYNLTTLPIFFKSIC